MIKLVDTVIDLIHRYLMPTVAAPSDQNQETVEIDGLGRAMFDNGMDSAIVNLYLLGKNRDRDTSKLMELLND